MPTAHGLPQPWLCQLIKTSEPSCRLSLARTCKELWSLMLFTSNQVVLKLNPNQDQDGLRAALCLQLLRGCRQGSSVKLIVRAGSYADENAERVRGEDALVEDWEWATASEKEAMSANTFWLEALCEQQLGIHDSPLQCVTHLELQGVVLGNLVPTCVVKAFPKLQHLTRRARLYHVIGKPFCPTACPQLHSLTLTGALVDWTEVDIDASQLKQQFRALPGLQVLTMRSDKECDADGDPYEGADGTAELWIQGITELSEQLTTLDLGFCDRFREVERLLDVPWHLEQLIWPDESKHNFCYIYKDVMGKLLENAPKLQQLVVDGFCLFDDSFASRCCSWRHLTLRVRPHLGQLDALPLLNLLSLSMDGIVVHSSEMFLAPAAAANLARVGSIISRNTGAPLVVDVQAQQLTQAEDEMARQMFVPSLVQCLVSLRQQEVVVEISRDWLQLMPDMGCLESLQAQLMAGVRAGGMQDLSLKISLKVGYDWGVHNTDM